MISYSQNFEDVILMRALGSNRNGFYIDVGASWPDVHSVTKAFYDLGWSGINIEPLPEPYRRLVSDRTRDINLRCALGESSGSTLIWAPEVDGWATVHPDIIENLKVCGHHGSYHEVPLRTLRDICEQYAQDVIHFLKVDVEGYEREVLSGADFDKYRPWVVIVEATYPGTPQEVHQEWETMLLESDYKLAYADGLNRFYVACEKSELMPAFRYPPNVFDNFKLFNQHQVEIRAAELESIVRRQEEAAVQATEETAQMRRQLGHLEDAVEHLEIQVRQERALSGRSEYDELLNTVKRIEQEKKELSVKLAQATIEIENYRSKLEASTGSEMSRDKSDSFLRTSRRWYREKIYPWIFFTERKPAFPDWLQSRPRRTKDLFTALKHSPMRGKRDHTHSY